MTSTRPASVAQELSAVLALGGAEAGKSIWLEPAVSVSLSWPGAAIPSTYRQGYFPSFLATLSSASLDFSAPRFLIRFFIMHLSTM